MNHLEKRIKERFPLEDILVINYTTMKEPATVRCKTCGKEYSLKSAESFLTKQKKCICKNCINNGSGGRLSLQDFQERINKKYPNEKLLVIEYSLTKNPCSIQCQNCGNTYSLVHAESFLSKEKKRVCKKCYPNKNTQISISIKKFKNWIKTQDSFTFEKLPAEIRSHTVIQSKCNKCGNITNKTIYDYLKGRGCGYCKKNVKYTKEEIQNKIGDEYSVLEYHGMDKKNLYKHNLCGFIFNANGLHCNCPRCHGSKGEKAIRFYLLANNILFEEQKIFKIKGHNLRVDFFLPEQNLIIEFQGEQHFAPAEKFGGIESLKRQQLYDSYKREYFQERLLEINYKQYNKISDILNEKLNLKSSSTISKESTPLEAVRGGSGRSAILAE